MFPFVLALFLSLVVVSGSTPTWNWMKHIPNSKKLSELTIPGTHESYARYLGGLYACQEWDVEKQLENGIRFFDVRLKMNYYGKNNKDNYFAIHHGNGWQRKYFGDVLRDFKKFLEKNPSETVLVRYKKECLGSWPSCSDSCHVPCHSNTFNEIMDIYKKHTDFDWNEFVFSGSTSKIPTLGETRRKIVFVNFDGHGDIGLKYYLFKVEDTFEPRNLGIKINAIYRNLDNARDLSKTKISVTFFNYRTPASGIQPNKNLARLLNKVMYQDYRACCYQDGHADSGDYRFGFLDFVKIFKNKKPLGALLFDYPPQPTIDFLISLNDFEDRRKQINSGDVVGLRNHCHSSDKYVSCFEDHWCDLEDGLRYNERFHIRKSGGGPIKDGDEVVLDWGKGWYLSCYCNGRCDMTKCPGNHGYGSQCGSEMFRIKKASSLYYNSRGSGKFRKTGDILTDNDTVYLERMYCANPMLSGKDSGKLQIVDWYYGRCERWNIQLRN